MCLGEQCALPTVSVILNQPVDFFPGGTELLSQTIPAKKGISSPVNQFPVDGNIVVKEGGSAFFAMLVIGYDVYRLTTLARNTMQSWDSTWAA